MDFKNPKTMAMILTLQGFVKWGEGSPLTRQDFKREWQHLFKEIVAASLEADKRR